jgi:hypothetical protein
MARGSAVVAVPVRFRGAEETGNRGAGWSRRSAEFRRTALTAIESRLEALPEGVSSKIGPVQVAARINESLRQQFLETTIPQTGAALALAARPILPGLELAPSEVAAEDLDYENEDST